MREARAGDTVRVHYTGTLDDGSVFDSSRGREPLEFTVGAGDVIAGFDQAVTGMRVGDEKTVTIAADDAYGQRRPELMVAVPRSEFPPHLTPARGERIEMSQGGELFLVTVREITEERVVLDANHPLAGEALTFALALVEIA
jgi:peptidylprolyl isomerase